MSQFSVAVFTSLSEENLVPVKSSFNFGKGNSHWAIVKPSDANAWKKVWSHHPYSPDLATNLGSKYLTGTRFSSESYVKTAAENWLNGQGCDFYQVGLNKLILRSDKCLNRFGDYVEK
ncbi:hypothetical protein AVEN_216437-1 [Araneus ventricosus]|uniref:Uncharacterized protein n=1 Tax=Araneus ventricosus TaxID=182803 RepID=A0A4Y2BP72_ARAVE|nr:hypothetical protein AVEN_216437-1 [Araneus ventricosus]